jgi:succinate-acetate transporter protein
MSDALLDYSSWSFQVIFVLIVLYLVVGLVKPAWVGAGSRRIIAIVSVVGMLIASTAFYVAVRPLDGAPDGAAVPSPGGQATTPVP